MGEQYHNDDEYENICFLCKRPESRAGKMLELPGGLCLCRSCMQKAVDSVRDAGLSLDDMARMTGMQLPPGMDLSTIYDQAGFLFGQGQPADAPAPEETREGAGREEASSGEEPRETAGTERSAGAAASRTGGLAASLKREARQGADEAGPGEDDAVTKTGASIPEAEKPGRQDASGASGEKPGRQGVSDMQGETPPGLSGVPGKAQSTLAGAGDEEDPPGEDAPEDLPGEGALEEEPGEDDPGEEPPRRDRVGAQGRPRMTNISMINLGDLFGMFPQRQRVRKRKPPEEEKKEPFDLKQIPPPHKIKAGLDEYVVGQEYAKKVLSVAVYNHYKRVACGEGEEVEIEKSNILMIGPTGCGKTYLVKTLARLLDVPLAITDATTLTEAGYIGDDIESVVSRLLAAADNDVERASRGIIFIDEIDKIAKKESTNHRDVSGESVQQGLLKLLEGSEVEVPVGATSKNAMVPLETVNTKDILFICGGAFPGLEKVIRERLRKQAGIGFGAELKDHYDEDPDIMQKVTVEDIRKFGMIPEFIGRLPILFSLHALDRGMLVRILKEPKNAILRQYEKLLSMDGVQLEFDEDALEAIADMALERKTGARGLRAVIETFMLDIMYEIPKDDNIGAVRITRAYIEKRGGPVISLRTAGALPV